MKFDFVEYLANYAVAANSNLIIQTAAGTFLGNPIFNDSDNDTFNKLMTSYELKKANKLEENYIALENVVNIETGSKIPMLIFFEDSILAVSYGESL